ncbi:MAG: DUF262 domain-containing HNH endonuclease family protein [Clostridia bacterium]|nr:DUF262 domain-containing HNH endonuclease family protein [Clostridia bacterium]
MANTSISVNKQSVELLLGTGKTKPFVIPDYQRPYAWNEEHVETLFTDLWEFTVNEGGTEKEGTYFLGSVVSYDNDQGEQEIIDGQQRITSLFLLLRAIYTKLNTPASKTPEAENFIKKIEPAIWRTDKLTGKVDYSSILITSKVINNEGNAILHDILETGKANPEAKDNYSVNYIKFQKLFDKAASDEPLRIFQFVYALLNQAILLPISADSRETALTIFSTLNDRGLPLSDADIFKAKIYNNLSGKEKDKFIQAWKDLDEAANNTNESIQQLFYYYMFYLRAKDDDKSTTTPGLRKYYSTNNKFTKLYAPDLMPNLSALLNLWKVINKQVVLTDEPWSQNKKILTALDILTSYPNEFWKYPVIIYYLVHRNAVDFEKNFELFLHKLNSELIAKYLVTPTINAVKSDILKLNAEIINTAHPKFDFKKIDESELESQIKTPHKNMVRMLLKTLAYDKQDDLLPAKWEIEHILPQKWQDNYFINRNTEEINEKIEHLGNKLPFEKTLNIIAGNGYFTRKKKEYSESKIAVTYEMSTSAKTDWSLDDIVGRDLLVTQAIVGILNKWGKDYSDAENVSPTQPTEEQLEQIAEFKKMGWIK